jgi:hypothetical protein
VSLIRGVRPAQNATQGTSNARSRDDTECAFQQISSIDRLLMGKGDQDDVARSIPEVLQP